MKILGEECKRKCAFPDGIEIKPDGINTLDPCEYKEVETHYGVTVHVLQCQKCGHVEILWSREAENET